MKISLRKFKISLMLAVPVGLWACTAPIYEDLERCESYLEFVYDYNMEFVCSFRTHVKTIDVMFFDTDGKYLLTHTAQCETQLHNGCRLPLSQIIQKGEYKVIAVGGLTDYFNLSDFAGKNLVAGETTIEQIQLALKRSVNPVTHEFSQLWGTLEPIEIEYDPVGSNQNVWQLPLLKYTNRFHISLSYPPSSSITITPDAEIPYTFEIATPEGAVYATLDNAPRTRESLSYIPYRYDLALDDETMLSAKINSVRLLDDPDMDYTFIIRNGETGQSVWEYDLIRLLERTKPDLGFELPTQEYLDRQSEWNIVVLYHAVTPDGGMIVFGVKVNGWILWLNDIEM